MFVTSAVRTPRRHVPCAMCHVPCAMCHVLILHPILCRKPLKVVLTLGLLWGGVLLVAGCDSRGGARPVGPRAEIADRSFLPLVSSESLLNLGEVPTGGQKQCEFWLTNRTDSPVEVAKIETSCDCLTIDLPNRVVSPAQKVAGKALLDLRHEPRFTGYLSIDVKGKGKSGQVVFELVVKVSVGGE